MKDLRTTSENLKEALDKLSALIAKEPPSEEALADFKTVIDTARTSVLGIAASESAADHNASVRRLRLRRAAQVCQGVLYGMRDGDVNPETPGYDQLQAVVDESLELLNR